MSTEMEHDLDIATGALLLGPQVHAIIDALDTIEVAVVGTADYDDRMEAWRGLKYIRLIINDAPSPS